MHRSTSRLIRSLAWAVVLSVSVAHSQLPSAPSGPSGGSSSISGRGSASDAMGGGRSVYQHSIFITGDVVLEDGSAAPVDTVVELRCMGQPNREAEVRTDGSFSFQFTGVSPEAKTGPRRYGTNFGVSVDCQLQVLLNGHYAPPQVIVGNDSWGSFEAGTTTLRRKGRSDGFTVSANSLIAPKGAQRAIRRGHAHARKKNWDNALKEYEKAVEIYPEFAAAWHEMGLVHEAMTNLTMARKCFEKAVKADSRYVPPHLRLAVLDANARDWKSAAERTALVIGLNPYEFPEAWFYGAAANFQLERLGESEKCARKAIALNAHQRYPQVVHILGLTLARLGRLEEAIVEMERFLEIAPAAPERAVVEEQLAVLRVHAAVNPPPASPN